MWLLTSGSGANITADVLQNGTQRSKGAEEHAPILFLYNKEYEYDEEESVIIV